MKKLFRLIIFVVLLLSLAGCCDHTWSNATCTTPKTCTECGATRGGVVHNWNNATCTTPKTCVECGKTEGDVVHEWLDATCAEPKTCSLCGATEGDVSAEHTWVEATCTTPRTCNVCAITEGDVVHSYAFSACEKPEVCIYCGAEGALADHAWVEASCTIPSTCENCKMTKGNPLGHSTESGTCDRCGTYIAEPNDESTSDDSTFSIHFIDVGQADAALVECDGHYMLIDGGNKADSNTIYSVLKRTGVSHLDIIVGTHAHEDHIGGIPGAFNYASASLTLCATRSYDSDAFEDFKKYANQKGGGIVVPSVGDTYSLGSAQVKIIGVNGGSDTNDTSIVLMIVYGETKFLFTGDAEREAEQSILNSGIDLSATVLKVGHHGSDTSTTYPFLREIMPSYAVISVGSGNSYGHPTEATLSRLRDADVTVFRTDLQGDIICTSDGKTVYFTVSRNSDADTLAPASKIESTTESPSSTQNSSSESDSPPDGVYYVLNTNSMKFHLADCGSVSKISASNKEYYTGTVDDLIQKGYSLCGNCKPYEEPDSNHSQTPTQTQTETMVWIPSSGSKYHSKSSCSNMKNPTQITKSKAIARGYTACKKCW